MPDQNPIAADIEAGIKKILTDKIVINPKDVRDEMRIGVDAGTDSLDLVELVFYCEDEFAIIIPDEVIQPNMTVGEFVRAIQKICGAEVPA